MEFLLSVDPAAADSILHAPSLAKSREGRPRSQPIRIVWHDGPSHPLLGQGLCLAEQKGSWRLERVAPADGWLPAQPAPILAEAAAPAALPDVPQPLGPIAAFTGRRTVSQHVIENAPVTLMLDKGVLHTVAIEKPAARLTLSGPEEPVRTAARLVAAAVPATVPLCPLAAEGAALANGGMALPQRTGAPELDASTDTVSGALSHIIGHLTEVILGHAVRPGHPAEAVHQMRVAVRRARSAVSIFKDAMPPGSLDGVRAILKALGSRLGPTRDWDVFIEETLPAVRSAVADDVRLDRLASAAMRRRRECRAALAEYLASAEFRVTMIELAWFAASLPSSAGPGLQEHARLVLQKRWKKLVHAGKRIEELDMKGLHALRLQAKQARYAAEMFAPLWPGKPAERFIHRLGVLQQRLGVVNDGAVASQLLQPLGGRHGYAAGLVAGYMAARLDTLRPRIVTAFEKFRRANPFWT